MKNIDETDRRILKILQADSTVSLETIADRLSVSVNTCWRRVRRLEETGIIERHEFRDGRARYEIVPEDHHDHLIDLKSGNVIEFASAEIEALQERIAREHGFKLVDHRLELYGVPLETSEDE